jgi:hypothetical protein
MSRRIGTLAPVLRVLGVAIWLGSTGASGQPPDNYFNPGTMGANALPPLPGESASIGTQWWLEVGVAGQLLIDLTGARDYSFTFPFHAELPFGRRASLSISGTPIEGWATNALLAAAWRIDQSSGLSRGDLRVEGKFRVWGGGADGPQLTIRAMTKTTTGKSAAQHRFLNAPAYQFDLLASRRWALPGEAAIELWGAAGFLAWQQQDFGQNDAPAVSATVVVAWPELRLVGEGRAYWGWQTHDKPVVVAVRLEVPLLDHLTLVAQGSYGLRDPQTWDVRLGVRTQWEVPEWLR